MNLLNVPCPVCGSKEAVQIDKRKTPHGIHRNVLCKICGMGYATPRPGEKTYLDFYRGSYTADVYGLSNDKNRIEEILEWRTRRSLEKIMYFPEFWKPSQKVLEVGAGTGAFLAALRLHFGCKVWGIEPSGEFTKLGKEYLKLPLFKGTYEDWMRGKHDFPKQFDRIVLDQILEHILEPAKFLQSLHQNLTRDGQIMISVPNLARPKMKPSEFFIFEHVSSFSPYALALLLIRSGFKPTAIFEEKPGSLQMTAAPFASDEPMLDIGKWGNVLTSQALKKAFAKL